MPYNEKVVENLIRVLELGYRNGEYQRSWCNSVGLILHCSFWTRPSFNLHNRCYYGVEAMATAEKTPLENKHLRSGGYFVISITQLVD